MEKSQLSYIKIKDKTVININKELACMLFFDQSDSNYFHFLDSIANLLAVNYEKNKI
jgi:hypothetical protein